MNEGLNLHKSAFSLADDRMELSDICTESHGATLHKSCRIRQNQTEPNWITYIKGNCLGQRAANVQEVFSRQQKGFSMFFLEGTDLQREACTMTVDSDPASDLLLTSYAI